MEISVNRIEDLPIVASEFLQRAKDRKVFAFNAPMGAGKTTFIAEVCRLLGVCDAVGSPTFSIVNEYRTSTSSPVYHFDFYRIDDPSEAADIGVEDYFYSGAMCFIEWPEKLGSLLPEDAVEVTIRVNDNGSRTFIWN